MKFTNRTFSLKVHKHLLGAEEKAKIAKALLARGNTMDARSWAMVFKRLPATIIKIAGEVGAELGVRP